jgi:hypothetical protein
VLVLLVRGRRAGVQVISLRCVELKVQCTGLSSTQRTQQAAWPDAVAGGAAALRCWLHMTRQHAAGGTWPILVKDAVQPRSIAVASKTGMAGAAAGAAHLVVPLAAGRQLRSGGLREECRHGGRRRGVQLRSDGRRAVA